MTRKILFTGIDGSGKSTSLDMVIANLKWRYRILKISYNNGYVCFRDEENNPFQTKFTGLLESIRPISKRFHCYSFFLMINFIYKRGRMIYLELLQPCDLIVYDTDTLLRPAVHMTFHVPLLKFVSPRLRLRVMSLFFGSTKNTEICFLDADPSIAVERIKKRGKPIEPHETYKNLAGLRGEFYKVIEAAAQIGFPIIKVNTDCKSPEEVAGEMTLALEKVHRSRV
jgi:thymidylate kinase